MLPAISLAVALCSCTPAAIAVDISLTRDGTGHRADGFYGAHCGRLHRLDLRSNVLRRLPVRPPVALDLLLLRAGQTLLRSFYDGRIHDLAAQSEVAAPLQFRSKRANSPSIAPARSAFAADRQGFASEISGAISFH